MVRASETGGFKRNECESRRYQKTVVTSRAEQRSRRPTLRPTFPLAERLKTGQEVYHGWTRVLDQALCAATVAVAWHGGKRTGRGFVADSTAEGFFRA